MVYLFLIPFILQAIVIAFDEGYFHIKRGLPKWERIGHPIDTLSVLACFVFVLALPFSWLLLKGFIALATLSCLLVTKDEFVHKHVCPAAEHWVHALLFINHPIQLAALGSVWPLLHSTEQLPAWLARWEGYSDFLRLSIWMQAAFIGLFFLYQIVYWNFIWKEKSTTLSTKN